MTLASKRDKALLLVGFAAALRRSELAALDHKDVSWVDQGLVLTIRRSKTDQAGAGRRVGIPLRIPAGDLPGAGGRAWCQAADIRDGRLFRPINRGDHLSGVGVSAAAVNRIVQRAVARTGTDSAPYSAHSLRAGFATAAAEAGSARSWPRRATRASPWPGATSARARCSATTRRASSGYSRPEAPASGHCLAILDQEWAVAHDAPSPGRFDGPPLRDTAPLVALAVAIGTAKGAWIAKYSDHAILRFTVTGVG